MEEKTIDNLPPELISQILCCLPFKDAGISCILSSKWRSCSRRMAKLVFDAGDFEVEVEDGFIIMMHRGCRFINAISQVLLHHEGFVTEFSLKLNDYPNTAVDSFISYLSKNSHNTMEKFTLITEAYYRIPASLYKFEWLTELCLIICDITDIPSSSMRFHLLSTLILKMVETEINILIYLLKRCPLLKRLSLDTNLIEVVFSEDPSIAISSLFECLVNLEFLSIFYSLIQRINGTRSVPKVLPNPLLHLKVFKMDRLSFSNKHMLDVLLLLIRSPPNLEELKLEINDEENNEVEEFVWLCQPADHKDLSLKHLTLFELHNLSDTPRKLDVIRLVLAKSPFLKRARLFLSDLVEEEEEEEGNIVEAMSNAHSASPHVKFKIKPFERPEIAF